MTADNSIQTFKCPACGAPLEPEAGKSSMKCSYCNETVFIPEFLRVPMRPSFEPAPQRNSAPQTYPLNRESVSSNATSRPSFAGRLITVLIMFVILGAIGSFAFGFNPFGVFFFANTMMTFGSEGIGQGMFEGPRALGVDGNGNIVVADYDDGRIQTFTSSGKFLSTFTVNNNGKPAHVLGMAVSRDGKIYVPNGAIFVYDEKGQQVGKIGDDQHQYVGSVALGTDGTLYALTFGDNTLVRFKQDGSIDLEVPNAVGSITGQSGGFPHLAVDGLGNIYIATDTPPVILKYSPQGKFVNQFGGEARDHSQFEAGKFISPMGIAVDGYGRIFINDYFDLQVFDSSGKYLNDISGGYYGVAFDEQNNLYVTPVTKNNVAKFKIQKPAQ